MCAPVPATLPQTSAMAEYLALAFTGQAADRRCWVYAGSQGTVKAAMAPAERQLTVNSIYGGVMALAQEMDGYRHIENVAHVKAHRSGEEYVLLSPEIRRLTDASVAADRLARAGAEMHPEVDQAFQEAMDESQKRVNGLAKL
eukprot:2945176-Pyramimonas_sp.AAC.1